MQCSYAAEDSLINAVEETSERLNQHNISTLKQESEKKITEHIWKKKNLSISTRPLQKKKSPDSCANAISSAFCCGNEMQGWSLADDNEVKETNNLSPVGFSNINN